MLGLMQDRPLLISQMIDFAARYYPDVEIVTRTVEGPIHRYGYRDAAKRAKKLAEALQGLGIKLGDRVGTIAWKAPAPRTFSPPARGAGASAVTCVHSASGRSAIRGSSIQPRPNSASLGAIVHAVARSHA